MDFLSIPHLLPKKKKNKTLKDFKSENVKSEISQNFKIYIKNSHVSQKDSSLANTNYHSKKILFCQFPWQQYKLQGRGFI